MLHYLLSPRPLMDLFTDSDNVRNLMGRFVQAMAVVMGAAMLLWLIGTWPTVATLAGTAAIAMTFTMILLLGVFAKIVQVIYVRGEDIRNLPETDFTMMSIFSSIVRLPGEVALIYFAVLSLPAMLLTWSGAGHIAAMLGVPMLGVGGGALAGGLIAFVTCWIVGFAALVAFSLFAELVTALASMANDVRGTRRALDPAAREQPDHSGQPAQPHARAA